MISPTGLGIRNDSMGDGHYGAYRKGRIHLGCDFMSIPGDPVRAPFKMLIERIALPKADSYLSGVAWRSDDMTGKMFYFKPDETFIGLNVNQGTVIGTAQQLDYGPDMDNHIHFQIDSVNPEILMHVAALLRKYGV